jgi:hypothetical protein
MADPVLVSVVTVAALAIPARPRAAPPRTPAQTIGSAMKRAKLRAMLVVISYLLVLVDVSVLLPLFSAMR